MPCVILCWYSSVVLSSRDSTALVLATSNCKQYRAKSQVATGVSLGKGALLTKLMILSVSQHMQTQWATWDMLRSLATMLSTLAHRTLRCNILLRTHFRRKASVCLLRSTVVHAS